MREENLVCSPSAHAVPKPKEVAPGQRWRDLEDGEEFVIYGRHAHFDGWEDTGREGYWSSDCFKTERFVYLGGGPTGGRQAWAVGQRRRGPIYWDGADLAKDRPIFDGRYIVVERAVDYGPTYQWLVRCEGQSAAYCGVSESWPSVLLAESGASGTVASVVPPELTGDVTVGPVPATGQRWRDTEDGEEFTLTKQDAFGDWCYDSNGGGYWPSRCFTNGRLVYVDTPAAIPLGVPVEQVWAVKAKDPADVENAERLTRHVNWQWAKSQAEALRNLSNQGAAHPWMNHQQFYGLGIAEMLEAPMYECEACGKGGLAASDVNGQGLCSFCAAPSVATPVRAHDFSDPYAVSMCDPMDGSPLVRVPVCKACGWRSDIPQTSTCIDNPSWRLTMDSAVQHCTAKRSVEKREARKESPFQQSHCGRNGMLGIFSLREEER